MRTQDPEDERIHAYLRGEMSEEVRNAFQQRLFADDDLMARVCEAENDLIDALARGELPPAEAKAVRVMLRDSSQEDRIRIASALEQRERRGARPRPRFRWEFAALAACIVLGVLSAALLFRNNTLEKEQARTRVPQSDAEIYSVTLDPGVVRGDRTGVAVQPPPNARTIELRMTLRAAGGYDRYRVDVGPESGRPVLSALLPRSGPGLRITVPRELLPPGAYEIAVSGTATGGSEPLDSYHFTIQ